jgi:hypothetical protein
MLFLSQYAFTFELIDSLKAYDQNKHRLKAKPGLDAEDSLEEAVDYDEFLQGFKTKQ